MTRPPVFALALALLFAVLLSASPASPENIKSIHPTSYVTDLADVLTPDSKTRLETLCTELEQKAGAQMAIITVHSLEGETAAQYGNELFRQLGIGGKKDDRGILLLVAPSEHQYWTEVGYGLEPVVTDARAGDAGRAMVPFLRQNNFSAGIEAAAWQLANYIAADRGITLSAAPPTQQAPPPEETSPHIPSWVILLVVFVVLRIVFAVRRSFSGRPGRRGGGWWIGPFLGGMGGGGWGGSSGGWSGSGGWGGGGGGFGGFGGGSSGGGGAGGSW
ncbi:MAG TPA: TPM domain-containing protein [Candidatus Bathyarchaeia archaeon]|nr:TPM domain-containing protein [Candidatus Bathyarchaeia archaeon]